MTPDEFLPRVLAAVEELALALSHTPRERQELWMQGFADRVRAQWCGIFAPYLLENDVSEMVADVLARVRAKRDEIEAAGVGRA